MLIKRFNKPIAILSTIFLFLSAGSVNSADLCDSYPDLCASSSINIQNLNTQLSTSLNNNRLLLDAEIVTIENQLQTDLAKLETQLQTDLSTLDNQLQNELTKLNNKLQSDISALDTALQNELNTLNTQLQTDLQKETDQLNAALLSSNNELNSKLQALDDQLQADLVGTDPVTEAVLKAQHQIDTDVLKADYQLQQDALKAQTDIDKAALNAANQIKVDEQQALTDAQKKLLNEEKDLKQTAATSTTNNQKDSTTLVSNGQKSILQEKSNLDKAMVRQLYNAKDEEARIQNELVKIEVIVDQKEQAEVENFNDTLSSIENGLESLDEVESYIKFLQSNLSALSGSERTRLEQQIKDLQQQLDAFEQRLVTQLDKEYQHFLRANLLFYSVMNALSYVQSNSFFNGFYESASTIFHDDTSLEELQTADINSGSYGMYFSQNQFLLPLLYPLSESFYVGATIPVSQQINHALIHFKSIDRYSTFGYSDFQLDLYTSEKEVLPGISYSIKNRFDVIGLSGLLSLREIKDQFKEFKIQGGLAFNLSNGTVLLQGTSTAFFRELFGSQLVLDQMVVGYRHPTDLFGLLPISIDIDWLASIPFSKTAYIQHRQYELDPPGASLFVGFTQEF